MRLGDRQKRLRNGGVELRRHDPSDYGLYGEWYRDEEVWRLTSWASSPPGIKEVVRLFEEREASKLESSFAIFPAGGRRPVGVISLMNINAAHASAELSVIVGPPEARHRGHGSDAITAILRHGFEDLDLNRIGLSVFDFNSAAISAYEKLGFQTEGRLRSALKRDGAFHDAILMSILREDWSSTA